MFGVGAVLAGCQAYPTHSVIVGSIPQDYRTTHPIIIDEQEQTLDVPVASTDHRLTSGVKQMIGGFAQNYERSASGVVRIMVPHGSFNTGAASFLAGKVRRVLVAYGVSSSHIVTVPYDAGGYGDAPIRLAYRATTAHTTPCGRWPADLTDDSENRNYENFGCATQHNLAAQIADPSDLIAPRAMSPIDSERRSTVYDSYVTSGSGAGSGSN
jgi:pilus assembly protein CpaD